MENGLSNIKHPSTERFLLQMEVLHESMCISKAGCAILRYIRQKIKIKSLMCQFPIKILESYVITSSSYQNLKIYGSNVQKKYSKMNERM